MARTIRCTVVQGPANGFLAIKPRGTCCADLIPWADPYIVALLEKLRNSQELDDARDATGELPPDLADDADEPWQTDWSPRDWPRK